jgi:ABC-type antimicrobial peptide transport system permease subunit
VGVSENTDDAIGVYAVLSWIIAQRTREIGVRAALGAQTADGHRMVLRQGLAVTGLGLAIGLGAAALLRQPMASLLFGKSVVDPAFATGRIAVSGQSG